MLRAVSAIVSFGLFESGAEADTGHRVVLFEVYVREAQGRG